MQQLDTNILLKHREVLVKYIELYNSVSELQELLSKKTNDSDYQDVISAALETLNRLNKYMNDLSQKFNNTEIKPFTVTWEN